jgi:serine/threonine protein kinase
MPLFKPPSPPSPAHLADFEHKERYRLLGLIGRGTCTLVYNAFDTVLSRLVAVKKIAPQLLHEPARVQLFVNEARLISYLDHPGVVTIFDTFLDSDQTPGYAMKLIEGSSLRQQMPLASLSKTMHLFVKLCETLAHVHDRGVVHLDIKPDNIMVGSYGEAVLIDWDSARLYNPKPYEQHLRLVRERVPIEDVAAAGTGTPLYMSPEQTRGDRALLGPESDIFSLGVVIYELMTGRLPFGGRDERELFGAICTFDPPPLHQLNPEVPVCLSSICARMLAKDPFSRYHSLHELLHDIDIFYNAGQTFKTVVYNVNEVILREGDPGDFAFTIVQGEVAVFKQGPQGYQELARLGKDEIVGEVAILADERRSATIVAAQPNTIIRIMGRQDVENELRKLSPWVSKMMRGLSRRFIELDNRLVAQNAPKPPSP